MLVVRVYKESQEFDAFMTLLGDPHKGDDAAPRTLWGNVSKWKLHLSVAYWLLICLDSPAAGPIHVDDCKALHDIRREIMGNKDLRRLHQVASGAITWEEYQNGKTVTRDTIEHFLLSIIDSADIICAVPSLASTQPSIANWKNKVARGIAVDEAANINRPDLYAVWGNTFLPCLLAGDEKQLAPVVTTLSDNDAEENAVNRLGQDGRISPLEFIKGFGWPIYRLRTQLRMAVGQFDLCKATFYADVDSVYGEKANVDLPEHAIGRQLESFIANKYPGEVTPAAPGTSRPLFVHCKFSRCMKDEVTGSKRNPDQIDIALTFLCDFLKATTAKAADILIITPYAAMIDAIASARKRPQFAALQTMRPASTIYSIQGQEGDMVAVIAGTTKAVGPGFTADDRRLNVMMSRHKSALVVFGDLRVAGPLEKTKPVAKGSKPPKAKEIAAVRVQNPEGEVTFIRPKCLKKINLMLLDLGRVLTIESAWKKKDKGKVKANDPDNGFRQD